MLKKLNTDQSWRRFRQARNELTDIIRQRKLEYLSELDHRISNKNNFGTKRWWKLVKTFLSKKGCYADAIPHIEHDGRVFYINHEKASKFNGFFVKQSSIEDSNDDNVRMVPTNINHIELSVDKVKNALNLKDLNPTKAVGSDMIHNKILITSTDVIVEALTILFNRSLQEGVFPTTWKTAHVTPVYKKVSKELCTNYRPISLLSCIAINTWVSYSKATANGSNTLNISYLNADHQFHVCDLTSTALAGNL